MSKTRKKRDYTPYINAILTLLLGVLFIVLKQSVIKYAMTAFGIVMIVLAVLDLADRLVVPAIIKAVIGVMAIVFGLAIVDAALYIMAALLIIYGLVQIYELVRTHTKANKAGYTILIYAVPVASVAAGVCLLINMSGTVGWAFIVTGVILIVEGVLSLADAVSH